MKVCIKNNEFNPSFISMYGEEKAKTDGYTIYEVPTGYENCVFEDFDDNGFNIQKYNARKQKEENQKRIPEIQSRLDQLSQDLVQDMVGEDVPDIKERKAEFVELHNELRILLGKDAREIK